MNKDKYVLVDDFKGDVAEFLKGKGKDIDGDLTNAVTFAGSFKLDSLTEEVIPLVILDAGIDSPYVTGLIANASSLISFPESIYVLNGLLKYETLTITPERRC